MTGAERWKRQERQIAAALGGVRLPNTGAGQCDVRAPGWAVQVKPRASLPGWLWDAVDQARRDAGAGEVAVVVLSEVQPGRKARRLVVLDFDRFAALIAGAGRGPPATGTATMEARQAGQPGTPTGPQGGPNLNTRPEL